MKKLSALLLALLFVLPALAEDPESFFEKGVVRSDRLNRDVTYWVFAPDTITEDTFMVIFLHGGGEVGDAALNCTLPASIMDGTLGDIPAVVVIPQMPAGVFVWDYADDAVDRIADTVMEKYGISPEHTALCGFSMGAIGTMDIASNHPAKYKRILVAAGRVKEQVRVQNFAGTEVLFVVGTRDYDIQSATIYQFRKYLEHNNIPVTLLEVEFNHMGTQEYVYTNPEIMGWVFGGEKPGFMQE